MSKTKRKICVFLVDRANYGRMKPAMIAIKAHPELELSVICAGTMVLERFDLAYKVVEKDGFKIDELLYIELEGSRPVTMAKSVGHAVVEFSSAFQRLKPDLVLMIGDRYEALGGVIAAAYMNIPLAHIQGGEISGSIDESARHAISKFAQYHFPSTQRAADYLLRMGEKKESILAIGCPSSDLAREMTDDFPLEILNSSGAGVQVEEGEDFMLVVYHPTTTEYGDEGQQMLELLQALEQVQKKTVLLWPNIDAGSNRISKAIRVFRTEQQRPWLRLLTNLSPDDYLKVLANACCCIGNSSSFVRDAGYFGTPVVLVGNRQNFREHDEHVHQVDSVQEHIYTEICAQLEHGRYQASTLYGDGMVGPKIAQALADLELYVQKHLAYADEL